MLRILTFLLFISGISQNAFAYPQFIGHGYTSCLTCHYNPYGNGPLTDYGRALAATMATDRAFIPDSVTDEELGERSGFFFKKAESTWFRPNIDYRGLWYKRDIDSETSEAEIIHMDANITLVGKFLENDKLVTVFNFGYAPQPRGRTGLEDEPSYRTREHYIGYRFTPKLGVYVGLMDKVFGIRIPDHIAFSRSTNGLAMNDQSHGFLVHTGGEKWELGINGFMGNLAQDAQLRQVGASAKFEYDVASKVRVGASVLSSKSDFLETYLNAFHAKVGVGKGSALLIELGEATKTQVAGAQEIKSRYTLTQGYFQVRRGTYGIMNVEYFNQNIDNQSYVMRFGPGIQYFPVPRIELRADIYNTRIFSDSLVSEDTWDLTGQLHLWF
ncbi:MAG: hypothetical protein COW01_13670 [Bdellovibrionales bacterium CG12_big_fil_rev_8_21_14_0_65_38_15]|nr:MAG: hypothetical protein COW79_16490 [Bdellovibrionales bacterium CG22_combo_CG10-13_8_21_14_all_38_13]PIQ53322.1 MAG: hypothetical protein COW01_13670 [Bdellovibrionales bacterium CG12_big_fil_rev_8_21_14_0_65_38_15]PIR30316.1 MAG: hypothetical protein COV38_06090 [Bdellovibrionales bacterium CG11_big_fil_rev_8_21_14_0_20_38_13]